MSPARLPAFALSLLVCCSLVAVPASAQDAAAWPPKIERRLPPQAKPLAEADRKQVKAALEEIQAALQGLGDIDAADRADVDIFAKALDYALRHNEFFDAKKDLARVETLRKAALDRIAALKRGEAPLQSQRGVVVRGYRSRLDDSVQPYGLVIPAKLDLKKRVPLYIWLHGRGDTSCDLQFIANFLGAKAPGPLQLDDAIIVHPFGRYCNGYKSAGESDVLEAVDNARRRYNIDDDRIVLAGFSMGGAGAWHLGAHHADKFCAVHAGAGFVDVKRYQNITADTMPPWYVQTLWGLYDVPDYRRNLLNVPLVAYSGEQDKQKASADIMEAELAEEGLKLTHLIGPGMGHKYHPEVLLDVQRRLHAFVERGRNRYPAKVSLQTKTLRYPGLYWVEALRLSKHWDDARIDAEFDGKAKLAVATKNVTALSLTNPRPGLGFDSRLELTIDGQAVPLPQPPKTDATLSGTDQVVFLVHDGKAWRQQEGRKLFEEKQVKRSGLQGPIDDAFLSRFTFVKSSAAAGMSAVDRWVAFESQHAADRWRELMRGEPLKADAASVDLVDAQNGNLILWGTPQTNPAIAKILDKLPIKWTDKTVGIGDLEFDATKVVPVLIYPNPLAPSRYVVLNSGLTFREAHDKTNSQQNPKLPDWAFVDVTQPPTDELPGKIVAAGFFDEQWRYQKPSAVDSK